MLVEEEIHSNMEPFSINISNIKKETSKWVKSFYKKETKQLHEVESSIGSLLIDQMDSSLSSEEETMLDDLLKINNELLSNEENRWHVKSQATWILEGDNNTKKFHKYENSQKVVNKTSQINDRNG
jgi:hypothetical protein